MYIILEKSYNFIKMMDITLDNPPYYEPNIAMINRPNGKSNWRSLIYCSIMCFTKDNKIEVKSHTYDHWTDVSKFTRIYEDETIPRMSEYSIIKLYNKHKNWEYVYYDIIKIQRDKKINSILKPIKFK